jgi:hypothetical protein
MAEDVSAEVAGLISGAKVFGSSENIRHGKYKMMIKRIHAQMVENDKAAKQRMAFWEMTPVESKPNPQILGDHVDYPGTSGPLIDDGTKPNIVGSNCALKVNFDGPGGRSAGSNIKQAILGLFGKRDGEISDDEINKTWTDLARTKDLKVGDAIGINPQTNQPIFADKAKQANPACGMYIYCETIPHRKRNPNEKGAYITKLVWSCVSPPGTGENTPELVAQRRAAIEAQFAEEEEEVTPVPAPVPVNGNLFTAAAAAAAAAPLPPAPAPSAPPAPPSAPWAPVAPWEAHPTAPGYFWSNPSKGGTNLVKSEAQLRAGQ